MQLVLDSSVFVASLVENEEKSSQCKQLLERVKNGEFIALEPYTVLIEVIATIRRKTGSETLANRVRKDFQDVRNIYFLELIARRAEKSSEIAIEAGLKGMDSIVVQIAHEFGAILVSLDKEILSRASKIVTIRNIDEF